MYYHIRIDYFDRKLKVNQTLYEYDYSTEDDVMEKVVLPFVAEKRIIFSGAILDAEDRRQISVYQTEQDIKNMVNRANQHVASGVFYVYHNSDLVNSSKYAKDITKEVTQKAIITLEESKKKESENKTYSVVLFLDTIFQRAKIFMISSKPNLWDINCSSSLCFPNHTTLVQPV